jgi:molybdopterin-synthase adenylyltransferase
VVGVGALGNEVARVLGLLGVGNVVLVDPDTVESNNLPRSIFFWGDKTIGQSKAAVVASAASSLFPDTRWTPLDREIADVGFQKISETNLLFSCVDSDAARLEIAYISMKLGVPVADAGLGQRNPSSGRVTYFPGQDERACFGCMLRPSKRREMLELWEATLRPCIASDSDAADLVSTPTMSGVIGCIQVDFGLRSLFENPSGGTLSSRSLELQIHPMRDLREFTIPVSAECPFHNLDKELHALPRPDSTFEELLDSTSANALTLDWPICAYAKCGKCGHEWAPMLRLAAFRRRRCPSCKSQDLREQKIVRSIARGSHLLNLNPGALQLPGDHLYTLQHS